MNHRTRSVAGVLALFALSLFLAEGVWVGVCPPDARHMAAATLTSGSPDEAAHASSDHEEAGSGEETGCPFGAIAIGGCVSAAALSAAPAALPTPDAGAGSILAAEVRAELVLSSSLFRPPRA